MHSERTRAAFLSSRVRRETGGNWHSKISVGVGVLLVLFVIYVLLVATAAGRNGEVHTSQLARILEQRSTAELTPHSSMSEDVNAIRLLLVGDIHDELPNVEGLAQAATQLRINHVLVNGDIVNIPSAALAAPAAAATGERSLLTIARAMDALRLVVARTGGSVFYIPGNHDPPQLFDEGLELDLGGARNIHGKEVQLAQGLRLMGWGGSTPAVQQQHVAAVSAGPAASEEEGGAACMTEKRVWEGYPFTSEDMARESLARLPKRALQATMGAETAVGSSGDGIQRSTVAARQQDQLLLLTHVGPRTSGTTMVWRDITQPPIQSGSTALLAHLSTLAADGSICLTAKHCLARFELSRVWTDTM